MGVLVTINILFMIFFFALAYMSIRYFINQIEKYPRITLEEVYNSKKLRMKYNIEDKVNPINYGYNYKEIPYKSGKIQLYGWFPCVRLSTELPKCLSIQAMTATCSLEQSITQLRREIGRASCRERV